MKTKTKKSLKINQVLLHFFVQFMEIDLKYIKIKKHKRCTSFNTEIMGFKCFYIVIYVYH